jgi:hypothetical protein
VVSRRVAISSPTAATSASLPTKLVSSARRLVVRLLALADLPPQQRHVQRRQRRARVDPEGVGQGFPGALVHQQRLAVPARRDEGAHQRRRQRFPQRVGGRHPGQLGYQLRPAPEGDLGLGPPFGRGQPQLLQSDDGGVQGGALEQADVLQGGPAPEAKCLTQQPRPPGTVPGRGLARTDQPLEPDRVDRVRLQPQPVAVRLPVDHPGRQDPAQPRHQPLEGVGGIRGRLLPPDPVDQRGLLDHLTRPQGQGGQQPPQPGARDGGQAAAVRSDLQWPE